ncbi:hypothetical protein M427DRAFT_61926 [Gonapodya prolifera JEL478]|uniref:Prefoldin beta-like protein n=1 Tax=Gonapodya prolifera (strain JEL478) TaxID=1344416 RepID=A0A139A1A5_GONPJ|nr:hypothetical protein M427DRAFT_61926 [Gonapodya prolifera JEL478]|eukprot:KXS10566.1 hypothetical protein M427DRAFT_61926 [Gonapodya prolifera JEL478]
MVGHRHTFSSKHGSCHKRRQPVSSTEYPLPLVYRPAIQQSLMVPLVNFGFLSPKRYLQRPQYRSNLSMSSSASSSKESPAEIAATFQKMSQEVEAIRSELLRMDTDREENQLVLDSITSLPSERRCFRLVSGVLMEKTVGEVVPMLKGVVENISKRSTELMEVYRKRESELYEYQQKYNIRRTRQ